MSIAGYTIARPKVGAKPGGDAVAIPDAPTLFDVVTRDLASGPGDGRSWSPDYLAWLYRAVDRLPFPEAC